MKIPYEDLRKSSEESVETKKGLKGNKKIRLIRLLQLLQEETDEQHRITTQEIIQFFTDLGLSVNRKTVRDDIEMLAASGFDVVTDKHSSNQYYMGDRRFQMSELKLLLDAVAASHIISVRKTKELTDKLKKLASKHQAENMVSQTIFDKRRKPQNENIYYNIDVISHAIEDGKKVAFNYQDYDINKTIVLRHDAEVYLFSPYMLVWNNDHYYMVGFSEKYGEISQFRVDRMVRVRELMDVDAVPEPEDFDKETYSQRVFNMMGSEDLTSVKLLCKAEIMRTFIDHFGLEAETRPLFKDPITIEGEYGPELVTPPPDYFFADVDVYPSPTFYSWIFQFGGAVKILGPENVVAKYKEMARKALEENI